MTDTAQPQPTTNQLIDPVPASQPVQAMQPVQVIPVMPMVGMVQMVPLVPMVSYGPIPGMDTLAQLTPVLQQLTLKLEELVKNGMVKDSSITKK